MTLTEFYEQLMIIQYYEKPKARAEIGLKAGYHQDLKKFIDDLQLSFDLENASGDRLDKIGKLVGQSRIVPLVVQKRLFGFDINQNALGFSSKFDNSRIGAPFSSKFTPIYTDYELDDFNYTLLIKARIANNVAHAVMVGDSTTISLQDVISKVFGDGTVLVDNKDMTLNLLVPSSFDPERLRLIKNAGLLPSPQGVGYKYFIQGDVFNTFGFESNPNSKSFARKVFYTELFWTNNVFGGTSGNEIFDFNYWGQYSFGEVTGGGHFARKLILG